MTNAEKIRAMTDEELAEFIAWEKFSAASHVADSLGINATTALDVYEKYILGWLKQEVKDNA